MDDSIVIMMLTGSLFLGFMGLVAFIWGLRSGQFDDVERFKHGALYDDENELNDVAKRKKKEEV